MRLIATYLLLVAPLSYAVDYKNAFSVFPEPAVPSVALNGSYTTFGNKVFRLTDRKSCGGGNQSWSHWYADRSALNAANTWAVVVNQTGGWCMIPISWTGAAGAEVPTAGKGTRLVAGAPGGPAQISFGFWDPVNRDRYWTTSGKQLWRLAPSTMTWTMVRDFRTDVPDMSAYMGIPCGYSPARSFLVIQGFAPDGSKLIADLRTESKNSFGTLLYNISTNSIIRFDAGVQVVNRSPSPAGPAARSHGGGVDKSFRWLFQQEGDPPSGCATGAIVHSYVMPIDVANLYGVATRPSYSTSGLEPTAHGVALAGAVAVGTNGVGAGGVEWFAENPTVGSMRGLRWTNISSTAPDRATFQQPYKFIFGWRYNDIGGYHFSANQLGSDTWVFMSSYQELNRPRITTHLAHEIIAVDTRVAMTYPAANKPTGWNILRLGHHHSYPEDPSNAVGGTTYYEQPHASSSLDGKFVVFGSTMGRNASYDLYLMVLPVSVRP